MELDNVEGVEGKLKVWIRRVWTLEMVRFFLIECSSASLVDLQADEFAQSVIGLR